MILVNESEGYEILYNNKPYAIPQGRFEVTQELGNFILLQSKVWDKKVYIEDKAKMKTEHEIIPEEVEKKPEVITPEHSEVTGEKIADKAKPKVDTNKVLKEAEEFLKGE